MTMQQTGNTDDHIEATSTHLTRINLYSEIAKKISPSTWYTIRMIFYTSWIIAVLFVDKQYLVQIANEIHAKTIKEFLIMVNNQHSIMSNYGVIFFMLIFVTCYVISKAVEKMKHAKRPN